ncbi:MAG: hypothetical protein AB7W59_15520 [Acidimicrobiia bacterium]
MSAKFLWRVKGAWPPLAKIEEGYPPSVTTRHFLTKQAAERRAQAWREGREYDDREPETGALITFVVPPALSVTVTRSEPITFTDTCPDCTGPYVEDMFHPVASISSTDERVRPVASIISTDERVRSRGAPEACAGAMGVGE